MRGQKPCRKHIYFIGKLKPPNGCLKPKNVFFPPPVFQIVMKHKPLALNP